MPKTVYAHNYNTHPIDGNVERVKEQLTERMHKGYQKYKTTTEREDIDLIGWLQHLQEELLDAAVYVEALKKRYASKT